MRPFPAGLVPVVAVMRLAEVPVPRAVVLIARFVEAGVTDDLGYRLLSIEPGMGRGSRHSSRGGSTGSSCTEAVPFGSSGRWSGRPASTSRASSSGPRGDPIETAWSRQVRPHAPAGRGPPRLRPAHVADTDTDTVTPGQGRLRSALWPVREAPGCQSKQPVFAPSVSEPTSISNPEPESNSGRPRSRTQTSDRWPW